MTKMIDWKYSLFSDFLGGRGEGVSPKLYRGGAVLPIPPPIRLHWGWAGRKILSSKICKLFKEVTSGYSVCRGCLVILNGSGSHGFLYLIHFTL